MTTLCLTRVSSPGSRSNGTNSLAVFHLAVAVYDRKATVTGTGLMLGREIIFARPAGGTPAKGGSSGDGSDPGVLALVAAA
jgi:hypothetical protein